MDATSIACDPAEQFSNHQSWLRTVILSRLGNCEEADEVMQEVALAAANQSAKREPVDRVAPWLYRVAIRQVLLMRRRKGRRRRLMAAVAEKIPPTEDCRRTLSPLDWLLCEERGYLVQVALEKLAERDRQLLLLKYVDGLSYEQIGQALGVTASSVQSRLHRARKLMREYLILNQIVDR